MTKPALLVVTRNFPPLTGGMERLMQHTVVSLAERFEVTLIGPAGSAEYAPPQARVIECPSRPLFYLVLATLRGIPRCLGQRFEYVFAGNGLTAPVAVLLAKLAAAKSVVHVHGLDLVAKSTVFQRLFVPWIRRCNIVIANSRNTARIAIEKGCAASRVHVLNPGTEIPHDDGSNRVAARRSTALEDNKVTLFVGRITRRKGLAPFLKYAWPRIRAATPEAVLVVIGDSPTNAVSHDPQEASEVRDHLSPHDVEGSVHFLGMVSDDELNDYYLAADVLVFPLIDVEGDVEGFGMVAVEAAARGTPTAAFAVGGVVDAVVDGVSGRLVSPGDYEAFALAVVELMNAPARWRDNCRKHADSFSWPRHRQRLFDILSSPLEQR